MRVTDSDGDASTRQESPTVALPDDMVERAARAMHAAEWAPASPDVAWDAFTEADHEYWRTQARVALAAALEGVTLSPWEPPAVTS